MGGLNVALLYGKEKNEMIKLVGESLKQYDLNRQVEIIPLGDVIEVKVSGIGPNPLPVCFEETDGRIYACIPDILLKVPTVVTVETLEILDNGDQVEQKQPFSVNKAKKPEGYVCPKPEILTPNYLKNNSTGELPFGETTVLDDTITWDGNTDGLYPVMGLLYRVSSATPTLDDMQNGGTIKTFTPDGEMSVEFTGEHVMDVETVGIGTNAIIIQADEAALPVFIATQDGATIIADETIISIEKAGIYFSSADGAYISYFAINNYTGFEKIVIKTIDPKYIAPVKTYFYYDTDNNLYIDEEKTTPATPTDVMNAYNKGQIVVKEGGLEGLLTSIDFRSFPMYVSINVGSTKYRAGTLD